MKNIKQIYCKNLDNNINHDIKLLINSITGINNLKYNKNILYANSILIQDEKTKKNPKKS